MAVPKRKPSLSVRRQRWHVQDSNKKYAIKRYNYCPTCSVPILPHNICAKCAAKIARQPAEQKPKTTTESTIASNNS
jgi:ribosomal protein L32